MRKGMTILEVLVSLSLLATLAVAVAGWAQFSARATGPALAGLRWERSACAVLDVIADDLLTCDVEPGLARDRRVVCSDGSLAIETRGQTHTGVGPVVHRYECDGAALVLVAVPPGEAGPGLRRSLIGDVASWSCAVDEEAGRMTVRLGHAGGRRVERGYRVR